MLGRPRAMIQLVKDINLSERNPSRVLQPSIIVIVQRKPHPNEDEHVGRTNVLLGFGWWPKTRSKRKRSIRPIPRRELKISARRQKASRNLRKKGDRPRRTRWEKYATYLQLLRKDQSSRREVSRLRQVDNLQITS